MSDAIPNFALSVRQPWAWAIIHAGKDAENRVKRAITMGRMDKHSEIAIHAATGMTKDEYEDARDFMASIGVDCPRPDELVRGAVIGAVLVTGVTKQSDSPWFFGPWALNLAGAYACRPIPCRGELGIFVWSTNQVPEVKEPLPWMVSWPDRPKRTLLNPVPADPMPRLI